MTVEIAAGHWTNGAWVNVDIQAALKLRSPEIMRCPECHGRVRAHKAGTTGQKAHVEHFVRHVGCSRSNHPGLDRSLHPNALT